MIYETLPLGSIFEFSDSFANPRYSLQPTNRSDVTTVKFGIFDRYSGVTEPPPDASIYITTTTQVRELGDNPPYMPLYTHGWGDGVECTIEHRFTISSQYPDILSYSLRWRLSKQGETSRTYNMFSSATSLISSRPYVGVKVGFVPFTPFKLSEQLYWCLAHRAYLIATGVSEEAITNSLNNNFDKTYNVGSGSIAPSATHTVFSDYWLQSLGWGNLRPDRNNKGEFKGMPTSNIPLRQFIRGNIDYRRTIDIYDETNYSPKNMFLTNRVGTLDYSQVEFGNPSGTIKVKSDINFTHFVSSSFSDDNRPIVYKVDHYETVGAGVIRCSYSVDYIKTFFQYHGITDNNPICMRSTSAVGYEPYIMDNAILSGDYDVNRTILSTNTVTALYVIKTINGIYATSEYGFGLFKSWLADNVNNKVIINQIEKIFIIPFGTFTGHSLTVTSGINFYKPIEGGYTTITFAPSELAGDMYSITPSNTVGSFVSVSINTSFSDKAMDFLGANSYCMLHVPYYGDIVLNASDIIGMSNNADSPKFHYYIDFDGGNVAVQYHNGDYDGLFHNYVQAPSPSISTVDLESIRYLEASQNIGYTGAITKTLTGLGSSAATGAVAGALTGLGSGAMVGAGVNAVTGLFSAAAGLADMARTNANEMQHLLSTLSTDTVQATGTASAAIKYFYVIMVTPKLSESLADYYDVVGYPIRKAWNTIGAVEGECYWLNWNFALIKDTEEIINGFALASSDGIIYNY